MKTFLLAVLLLCNYSFPQTIKWYSAEEIGLKGKGFNNTENFFDRLPASAKNKVHKDVWRLSHHSSGMYLKFYSTSDTIYIDWSLTSPSLQLPHMPTTGVSGLDLYKLYNDKYIFLDNARPGKQNKNSFRITDFETETTGNYYLLYLPLYNGITELNVGVPENHTIIKDTTHLQSVEKPVVFYGTSIMQGGVASRPGMNFTAMLQRRLDIPLINLGLSGNGKMEPEVIDLIAQIDASLYIFDCHRNMSVDEVKMNTEPAIRKLKMLRPGTPVLLVEESNIKESFPTVRGKIMREVYDKLINEGMTGLFYLEGNNMLGNDFDGTVDGVHPNDLGFERFADNYEPVLKKILNLK